MYRIKPFRFLAWWLAAGIFVFPVAIVALGAVFFPLSLLYGSFAPPYYADRSFYNFVGEVSILPIMGAIIALTMASLQRSLLRSKLFWAADGWRRWSVFGGFVAGLVLYATSTWYSYDGFYNGYTDYFWFNSPYAIVMPLFLAIVALAQFFPLRHAVKYAWLWTLGNIAAGIAFTGVLMNNQFNYSDAYHSWKQLGVMGLAIACLGLITGFVILYLFERHLQPMKPDGMENIPVDNSPKSVWDEAI